jgi:hypothetical protein
LWISDLFEDGQSLDEYLSDLIGDHNRTREDNKVLGSNTNATLGGRPAYYLIEENKEGWETKNMMVGILTDDNNILEIEYVITIPHCGRVYKEKVRAKKKQIAVA